MGDESGGGEAEGGQAVPLLVPGDVADDDEAALGREGSQARLKHLAPPDTSAFFVKK